MFSARRKGSNPPRGMWHMGMGVGEWHADGGARLQESRLAMAGGDCV